ncbi:hypothetical protein ABT023_01085 [Micromonospora sp. NPDC002296]|uniref:hypothetical protein n=1 Tax=Micromonospora sp. NPDC002296 TaxID=3154271 RepID=UPI003322FC2A
MARRGWGGSIATAVGVAAGAGAAQLGFGYGLGIISWAATDVGGGAAWVASLAWSTWIASTSTIAGAVCAQRLRQRGSTPAIPVPDAPPAAEQRPEAPASPDVPPPGGSGSGEVGGLGSTVLALAGGAGALVTLLLVAVPARVASVPDVSAPQAVAAAYAGAGVLIGMLVARWALRSPAAATAVIATVGWLWLLAMVTVADGVFSGRGLTTAQLGIWQLSADRPGFWIRDWFYWPGALLALGSALLIGALAARRTARSPEHRLGAAASGAAGPLLVALAYLLAVPGLATIGREQVSAHLIAPYAVLAGLAGSMLTATLAQRARRAGVPVPPAALPGSEAPALVPRQRAGLADAEPETPTANQVGPLTPGTGTETPAAVEAATAVEVPAVEAATTVDTPALDTPAVEAATEPRPSTAPKPRGGRRTR